MKARNKIKVVDKDFFVSSFEKTRLKHCLKIYYKIFVPRFYKRTKLKYYEGNTLLFCFTFNSDCNFEMAI